MQSKLNYVAIEECIAEMKLVEKNIKEIANNFLAEVNCLSTGNYWNGAPAEFYIKKASSFHRVLEEGTNQLNSYINILVNTVNNYKNIEKSIIDKEI